MANETRTATLRDVAGLVGLSVATVSAALNGSGRVSTRTRERVEKAAGALNYVPNLAARSLIGVKTNVIGVVLGHLSPAANEIVWGVNDAGRDQGRQLLIATTQREAASEVRRVRDLAGGLADGIVLISPISTPDQLRPLTGLSVPVVLVNYRHPGAGMPQVYGENVEAACRLTEHLISLGHRRIAFANGHRGSGQTQERERGFRLAMARAALPVDERLVFDGDYTSTSGALVAERILSLGDQGPTAVFGANDQIARGLVEGFTASGARVPDDYSVVGFDGAPMERLLPELTTAHHPFREVGTQAARLIIRLVAADAHERAVLATTNVEVPTTLAIEASTAPPRRSS